MKSFFNQLSTIIIYGGILQGVFIILLLNNKDVKKGRANLFLSILLFALSFSVAHVLFAGAVINHLSARVYSIGDPTFYLIAPLLWFYTRELTGDRVVRRGQLLLHFLPFVLLIFLSLSLNFLDSYTIRHFLQSNHHLMVIFFWIALVVQFSWYQVLVHRRWIVYQKLIRQEVSNTENVSVAWVRFFMIVFLIINLAFLFSLIVVTHVEIVYGLAKATALVFSLSIFALGYKGILQREIFQTGDKKIEVENVQSGVSNSIPDRSKLDHLLVFMEENKPYLDSELTLTALAGKLNITRSQLSALINEGTGDNFYDFINKYRVDQVKKLMVDPSMKHFSLLGLSYEAGFKSKSTFNLIFKRFTGLTPSEFRKNQLS